MMRTIRILAPLALLGVIGCDSPPALDMDGDGVPAGEDCDDSTRAIYPGSAERCDGLDNDCNGVVDDGAINPITAYADVDGDGYGGAESHTGCEIPSGFVVEEGDCDDTDAAVRPDAQELCDGLDNDCDGALDEDDDSLDGTSRSTWHADADGDGYGDPGLPVVSCDAPLGYVLDGGDCDDTDPAISPETVWYADADKDGYGAALFTEVACAQPDGFLLSALDCDDRDPLISPGAQEICDGGIDNDCDGLVDHSDGSLDLSTAAEFYPDTDLDGFGNDLDGEAVLRCKPPHRYASAVGDCDDSDAAINPGAAEVCEDGLDNDCDGTANGCGLSGPLTDADADYTLRGSSGSSLGYDLTLGDLNGDAVVDVIVGAYTESSSAGRAYIIYGGITADLSLSGDQDALLEGASAYDYAGKTMTAGDLDGDGYDELLISAYGEDTVGTSAGAVYVLYGTGSARSGTAGLSSAADVTLRGGASYDALGQALQVIGDINGDGYPEVAMGADGADGGGTGAGAVYIMMGSLSISSGSASDEAGVLIDGARGGDALGDYRSISPPLDADGDGIGDLLLASRAADNGGTSSGSAYLFHGSTSWSGSLSASDADARYDGASAGDRLGEGLGAGDLNRDGYDDMVIGADGEASGAGTGAVYVFFGSAAGASGTHDASRSAGAVITSDVDNDALGEGVAAGDVDMDGTTDLVVGDDGYEAAGSSATNTGIAYVFYGPLSGTTSTAAADVSLTPGGASYGYGGQDLWLVDGDGDGINEIWLGQYGSDRAFVFIGGGL